MKRLLLLAIGFFLAFNTSNAQETIENELELVRKLREKGWNDFAKNKIEELLKRNDPKLNASLPLELARINISMARQLDPEQRFALFTTARAQLQDFINKNQGKAEAALASVELARVTSYHAQAILSRAMREEETRARHEKARPAEAMFIEAGKALEEAIKNIDAALQNPANAAFKTTLEREQRQARFDLAINIFDQAKTYIDRSKDKVNLDRSTTMSKAIKAFTVLRSDESSEIGWLANAWLMKCSIEITAPDDVVKYHKSVMDRQKDAAVQPALRLVRYFAMQDMTLPRPDEPETIGNNSLAPKKVKTTPLDRLHAVQKEGEAWLKAYPNFLKTYEGQGVRYELGHAYLAEAYLDQEKKDAKAAKKLFDLAAVQFDQLAKYDGELAERASQLHMSIELKTVKEGKTELKTFDQFYMKAMLERKSVIELSRKLDAADAKEAKKIEGDRKTHLKGVITALSKALSIADTRTPVQKVDDARYFLCGAYLAYGDPYRAAIIGEALGRGRTTRRAPEGAATAIQTYSVLQSRNPDDVSVRQRLTDLASFVLSPEAQATWKGDPVTSMAHYHLAMAAKREDDPKKAIEHLNALTRDFVDYIYTQGQLVFIAQAAREKAEDEKEKKFYLDAAKAAIERMPMYDKDDSASVVTMYYFAKLEKSKFMYAEAFDEINANQMLKANNKLNAMSAYVRDLQKSIAALPGKAISPENREQIEFTMNVMLKYADLGQAEAKFRDATIAAPGRYDQVLAATKTVVDDVLKKGAGGTGEISMKDYRVTADILSLALRANVQKGNVEQGKAILEVLNRLKGPKDERVSNVVAVLLSDIANQIRTMKENKDKALETTRDSYSGFLDVISKDYESKGNETNAMHMLAHAYLSLDFPAKAAAHFAKIKAPPGIDKALPKKNDKMTEKELEALQQKEEAFSRYWGIQIEYIRALRAAKDKESLKTAESAANAMIENKNARFQLHAMMEKNHIYEDQGRFRESYLSWKKFLENPSLGDRSKKEVQNIYFPGYFYYVRTLVEMGLHDPKIPDRPDPKNPKAADRQKFIETGAKLIMNLEFSKSREGWQISGPLFEKMLKEKEFEKLKKEYDKQKVIRQKMSAAEQPRRDIACEDIQFDCPPIQGAQIEVRLVFNSEGVTQQSPGFVYSRTLGTCQVEDGTPKAFNMDAATVWNSFGVQSEFIRPIPRRTLGFVV